MGKNFWMCVLSFSSGFAAFATFLSLIENYAVGVAICMFFTFIDGLMAYNASKENQ